jgi:hypothetical protein
MSSMRPTPSPAPTEGAVASAGAAAAEDTFDAAGAAGALTGGAEGALGADADNVLAPDASCARAARAGTASASNPNNQCKVSATRAERANDSSRACLVRRVAIVVVLAVAHPEIAIAN